ncbi:hypothetical protein QJQ45_009494 [Haematococcus lacustris]|nr:hypothetical protein QJQ45_009494 [Haematococcus lacustris]
MTNSAARRVSGDFMPVIDDLQHLDGVVLREQEHCSPVLACQGVCDDQSSAFSIPNTNVSQLNDDLSVSDAPTTRLQEPDTGFNPCFKAESHHEHPAVAAWKAGRLGLTFSGGGFLLSYHLGKEGGTRLRLGGLLRQQLMQELPDKAEEACSGRAAVAVTQALPVARRIMVTEFHSREDLLDALTASCWLPRYSGPSLTCTFRGRACMDGGTLDLLPPLPWSSMRLPGPPGQATDQSRLMVAEESMEAKVVKARSAIASTYTVKVCCFTEVNCLALPLPAREAMLAGGFDICPGGASPLPYSAVKAPPLHKKHLPATPGSHLPSTGPVGSSNTKVSKGGVASVSPALEAGLGAPDLANHNVRPGHHGDQITRSDSRHPVPPQPASMPQVAEAHGRPSGVQGMHRDKLGPDVAAAACCTGGMFRRKRRGHGAHGAGHGVQGLPPSMRSNTSVEEGCTGLRGEAQCTAAGATAGQNVTPGLKQPNGDEAAATAAAAVAAGTAHPCGPSRSGAGPQAGPQAMPSSVMGQAGLWDRLAASVRHGLSTAVSRAKEVEAAREGQGGLGQLPHPSPAAAQQLGQRGARWPYSGRQMLLLAMEPAGDAFLIWLHERGKADALAWAHTTGLAHAVCSHAALYQQPRCLALVPSHVQADGVPTLPQAPPALPSSHAHSHAIRPGESLADFSSRHRDAMARSAAALLACKPLVARPQPEPGPHSSSVTPRGMLTPCLTSPTAGRCQEQESDSMPASSATDAALGKMERGAGQQAGAGHGLQQLCTTGSGCADEVGYSLVMGDSHEALARHDSMSRELPVSVLRMVARLGFGMTLKL